MARGNAGKADGLVRGHGKDEGQDQQGWSLLALPGFGLNWPLVLDRQALPAINLGVFNSCQPNPRGECCTSDLRPPRHFPAPLLLEVPQLANSSAPIKNYGVF